MGAGVFVLSLSYFLYSYWVGLRPHGGRSAAGLGRRVEYRPLLGVFRTSQPVRAGIRPARVDPGVPPPGAIVLRLGRQPVVHRRVLAVAAGGWRGVGTERSGAHRGGRSSTSEESSSRSYSAALIDAFELAGIRQLNAQRLPTPNAHALEFKTTGPYGLVRHPIYLGWFLIVFAVGTMTMTRFVFAVVSCAYILVAIPFEERSIRASSGERLQPLHEAGPAGNSSRDLY